MSISTQIESTTISRRDVHTGWQVRAASGPVPELFAGQSIPAVVPGVVHQALLDARRIPDPYLDDNESALAWIGLVDWTYETTFEVSEAELSASVHELVFEGLDTVATVSLNGEAIAEVANQHRTYRFDVTGRLLKGDNRLTVAFRSPLKEADSRSVALGARPRPYPHPYDAIRKSACSFGWDWGIATFTSGIWRPVRLEFWSIARLAEVRVHAAPDGDGGRVDAAVRIARAPGHAVALSLRVALGEADAVVVIPADESEANVSVALDHVDRWWPAGHGQQPLYEVIVTLADASGQWDAVTRRVGFRTLQWNTTPDGDGSTPFQLLVNDRPVFVKGVNWIPDDALFPRVDRARYERRLRQAVQGNLNLIRVWGGGIYESDDFYDLCDELGLLTWQDFLFACAAYAEEEPLRSEIEAEARDNVARLGHHTSLALLTGNNENLWGHEDWSWKEQLDGKTWGAAYYYELLPALVGELAPHVTYAPGSPFSPSGAHPNDERHGTMHLWEQWNRLDWATYREVTPRFVAEFGWQGPPSWATLVRSVSDAPLTPESPGMIVHQKAAEGNAKLTRGLVPHYRVPSDMETWHWAMQLNQANAVTAALEWFRSHEPFTAGAIVWQLNDCWPVTSWAAIDGDGREKPLYFALKNAFAPRVVILTPRDAGLSITVGNDTDEPWQGDLALTRRDLTGSVHASRSVAIRVAPRTSVTLVVDDDVAMAGDVASEVIVAEVDGVRGFWFFAEPRDSALAPAELTADVERLNDGGYAVTVTAGVLVRDLTLLVDKLNPSASVDAGLVTLLAGESFTFRIHGITGVDLAAILEPEIARSGNQLVTA